jgi:hypothetical protein
MSNNDIPKELHCPVCVPFDDGFKCNELVCKGLTLTTPYTSETLQALDIHIKSGKGLLTLEVIETLAAQLNVKVIGLWLNQYVIKDIETGVVCVEVVGTYGEDVWLKVWDALYALYKEHDLEVELWYDSTRIAYDCPYEAAEAEFDIQINSDDSNYTEYLDLLRIACEKYNQYTLRGLQGRMGLAEAYLYGWGVLIDQPKALEMFRSLSICAVNLIQIREDL